MIKNQVSCFFETQCSILRCAVHTCRLFSMYACIACNCCICYGNLVSWSHLWHWIWLISSVYLMLAMGSHHLHGCY